MPKNSKSNPVRNSPRWVDLSKPLKRQLSNNEDPYISVYFRIMFYVANINVLQQETTRYVKNGQNQVLSILGGSELCIKFARLNYVFKRRTSYHFKA